MQTIHLSHDLFSEKSFTIYQDEHFVVSTFRYASGVEGMKIDNEKGYLIVLPYMGLIIWDAVFEGISLKMKDMFTQPLPAGEIADTYGCFQFSSGLLGSGTPAPEDHYQLHGEFPTSPMEHAYLTLNGDTIGVHAEHEYVKGFGNHYLAHPSVVLRSDSGLFDINLEVTNLSKYQPMPLQYMCHMNYVYIPGGHMEQNIPDEAFTLRATIPSHVHPTKEWLAYNDELKESGKLINDLNEPDRYDPEIVFFSNNLGHYSPTAEFRMCQNDGHTFLTRFRTSEFPIATRWILYNPDQQVAAFVLPGTSTPEGREAARKAGTLIELQPMSSRNFHVTTGLEK